MTNREDVVLTGVSGRMPESGNMEEFMNNLLHGVDMVTADDRRWVPGLHGLPARSGKLKDLAHFDAAFFGVPPKQAHLLDPQVRLLLELTQETFIDAGYNPAELRGSRTGVYVGVTNSESEEMWNSDPDKISGYAMMGCNRSGFANRVSFCFDLKGPSLALDTACSSSFYAMTQAVEDIRTGRCDAAVVAGTHLCLKPETSLNFHRLSVLSPEGRCASFDAEGCGYVRSEATVVVLLQRREAARRVYCTVRGARVNVDGAKEQGLTFPSGDMQRRLAAETFAEARLDPRDVLYVEAHGTGTKVGDPQEVNMIADLFCRDRKTPLLLGSVKSNMGHAEPASGLCAVAKVLIAMELGVIPQNIHYKSPNTDIPALVDGRIKVVDRNTPWEGGLVAINSFGLGGSNAHVILESPPRSETRAALACAVPRLVLASGRHEEATRTLLELAMRHRDHADLHALLHAVHRQNVVGHPCRGFTLLTDPSSQEYMLLESGERRPVWFVFSGMGSQCAGAATALMTLPIFAASIHRSAAVLRPHNIDLINLLTAAPISDFDDVITSFVFIAAVQVALVDVLRDLDVKPDGIVGHSVGEIGCGYADQTLTAEQTVLAAYWRGRSIIDSNLPPGAMAAVGLSWTECETRCPADIVLACQNAPDNVTVSGPVQSVIKFVAELTAEGVFARHVNSSGVAFHSKYVAPAGPLLRKSLQTVIPNPKPRSSRWVSTSVPKDKWDSDLARLSDVRYYVNNLLSPVFLADALTIVPKCAVVVEVAPHAVLHAVLRRALPDATHIPLLTSSASEPLAHLLRAVGRLYCVGAQPDVARLYPPVSFPVSRGTPGLSSHVLWDHSQEWDVAHFGMVRSGENIVEYDMSRPEDSFISGHNIDGLVLFPATGYLFLVWKTIAKLHNRQLEDTPVLLENITFNRVTVLSQNVPVRFQVTVLEGTGEFNLCEGGSVVVTGKVCLGEDRLEHLRDFDEKPTKSPPDLLSLDADDIYKELRLRGYNYSGVFCGIRTSDSRATTGELVWNDNWISFMDTMLQFDNIGSGKRELYLPTSCQRAVIDPRVHLEAINTKEKHISVRMNRFDNVVIAGGIELSGVQNSQAQRRACVQEPVLEEYVFLPYHEDAVATEHRTLSKFDAFCVSLQLVLENLGVFTIKVVEAALDRTPESLLLPLAIKVLEAEPYVYVDATLFTGPNASPYTTFVENIGIKTTAKVKTDCHLLIAAEVLSLRGAAGLVELTTTLSVDTLLLLEESHGSLTDSFVQSVGLVILTRQVTDTCEYVLLKPRAILPLRHIVVEVTDNDNYNWVDTLRDAMASAVNEDVRIYVVTHAFCSGVLGLAACLRTENGGRSLRVYYLPDTKEAFNMTSPTYATQIQLDLAVNVLRGDVWGCYRHLVLNDVFATRKFAEHAYIDTLTRGDLSSLHWIESPINVTHNLPISSPYELCQVYYAPLNFRDVMLATGTLSADALPSTLGRQERLLGIEFSGRTSDGTRVMGMGEACGLASSVVADRSFMWEVPKVWTLEQAATVPVAYCTAYYALCVRGGMRKGEAVLIHTGSSSVGQAAIRIALAAGCTVYTTVGTTEKRIFLLENFPTLAQENIANSRDTTFERMIKRQTRGHGVDLVLNSLASDKLHASVRCLARGGRFLEIGKQDLFNDTTLGLSLFLKNTTFHGIVLETLFRVGEESGDKTALFNCLTDGIERGVVRPLPATIFSADQLEQAFRCSAAGSHIGKVVLRVREERGATRVTPRLSAVPRTYMMPNKSYVLVGGLGGVGLELSQWLVERGANRLVINSRGPVHTGYQAWCIRRWREAGIQVTLSTSDATCEKGARSLLREAAALGPVGGVFNLAAIIKGGFIDTQTPADYGTIAKPKINVTKVLDVVTRELTHELDYFVVFSSVRGNPAHGSYGLANSAMERICERRRADGLVGLAVQWGAIDDVGVVTRVRGSRSEVAGTEPQRLASCLLVLDVLLAQPQLGAVLASRVLVDKHHDVQSSAGQDVVQAVSRILGIKDHTKVSDGVSLSELGMDSLMSAQIQRVLERHDLVLIPQHIKNITFKTLRALDV